MHVAIGGEVGDEVLMLAHAVEAHVLGYAGQRTHVGMDANADLGDRVHVWWRWNVVVGVRVIQMKVVESAAKTNDFLLELVDGPAVETGEAISVDGL